MIRSALICICTIILCSRVAYANVRLTEVTWMGTVESQYAEWFELYNSGSDEVSVAGWKLYEGDGQQLVITLTKTIPANSYLLVERVTPSVPDPVPGIDDEAGSFGGSGFANTGEDLVLKNSQGETIQSLHYSSGWPAGDAESKQTMQWNGSSWVTAAATPKAGFSGDNSDGETDSPSSPSDTKPLLKKIPEYESHVELTVPKKIYAKITSEYSAQTFLENGLTFSGIFLWNMGDGNTYSHTGPTVIQHTYLYPGTYTISFAYYKSPYNKTPFLTSSLEREVSIPKIGFRVIPGEGFEFTNNDTNAIDLSGWNIVSPTAVIQLPVLSIVAPKKTIIMPFRSFGIGSFDSTATLQTPQRNVVDSGTTMEPPSPNIVLSRPVGTEKSSVAPVLYIDQSKNPVEEEQGAMPDPSKQKTLPKKIVFGVIFITVIVLFIVIERFVVSREE